MTDLGQLIRFLLVGGAFAGAYSLGTALLVGPAGLPPLPTAIGLYALAIPAAFFVQMRVTFRLERTAAAGFPIYAATQLVSLALVTTITTRFVTRDVILDTGLFLASAGAAAVLSFFVSKTFAFKPKT